FSLPEHARLAEPAEASPGVTYPRGFLAGGFAAGIKQSGRPDLGVVCVAQEWRGSTTSAGVFTTNAFAAAPVIVTRDECDLSGLVVVVVNSGNANACTGEQGLGVARGMQSSCARVLGVDARRVGVASTGIIGVQLDEAFMSAAAGSAAAAVGPKGGAAFSSSIVTTDRYPKACAVEIDLPQGKVRIGACAKGAGMISPAMATMIGVVTTDAALEADAAAGMLRSAVAGSFNQVTVDGEMSTNDSVFFLANGASGIPLDAAGVALVGEVLKSVLLRIALMMVADGEGATKVIKATVRGGESDEEAARVCRAIADSPLVKTAMHGSDPNWGRVISSAGAALPGRLLPETRLSLCGVEVVAQGAAAEVSEEDRAALMAGMKHSEIEIDLDLGVGAGESHVFFSDLGHEYITINAEYHS
ncbi:MAG TPA: bifunctional glutamate N-acetyltransferase/amino-acid acetyltransferase ArgJ, partial [Thermoleophilia bacterium]|nr:bifunctional glutamate N-acetyltransferase/amino-acid acetyltransferase ArgJ [Thermoleophilia bacterium]